MIISALNQYYKIISNKIEVPSYGYSIESVSFEFKIDSNSNLIGIIPLENVVTRGKKTYHEPKKIKLPQRPKRTGNNLMLCFLYDNANYVIGLAEKDELEKASKRFTEFKKYHHEMLDGKGSIIGDIFLNFLDNYSYEKYQEIIDPFFERLVAGGNIIFKVDGKYLHEDEYLQKLWMEKNEDSLKDAIKMQCSVTGEISPISRTHPNIKGLRGGQASGASIVSFNETAYESYNKVQGYNAPISNIVTFNYTTALNYLLASDRHKINIGDTTIVFWAESDNPGYIDVMNMIFNPPVKKDEKVVDLKTEDMLLSFWQAVKEGRKVDYNRIDLNPNTKFYALGLSPNAARIAIRFFYSNTFGETLERLLLHFSDLAIEKRKSNDPDMIPLWMIINETINPQVSKAKPNPLLSGNVMRSILNGTLYPKMLLEAIINRIRCDRDNDTKRQINYVRVSIIKAYLNRYARIYNDKLKEVLNMSLNENSTYVPYLLGRLFAILEKAQKDANPNLNTTIKDRYFSSACATPSTVFPTLLKLAQTHISKSDYGYISEKRISEVMEKMVDTKFPAHLSLEDQGVFVIGYYHQSNDFYKNKNINKGEYENGNN